METENSKNKQTLFARLKSLFITFSSISMGLILIGFILMNAISFFREKPNPKPNPIAVNPDDSLKRERDNQRIIEAYQKRVASERESFRKDSINKYNQTKKHTQNNNSTKTTKPEKEKGDGPMPRNNKKEKTNIATVTNDDISSQDKLNDEKKIQKIKDSIQESEEKQRVELARKYKNQIDSISQKQKNPQIEKEKPKQLTIIQDGKTKVALRAASNNKSNFIEMDDESVCPYIFRTQELDEIKIEGRQKIKDYWYKINYKGKSGWVFGYYTNLRQKDYLKDKSNN